MGLLLIELLPFLAIAGALFIALGGRAFLKANPAVLARRLRIAASLAVLGFSGLLLLRGLAHIAIPIGGFGWLLLMRSVYPSGVRSTSTNGSSGRRSTVRTGYVEMELDHATGAISGRVLKGSFTGRALTDLSVEDLVVLWQTCGGVDLEAATLIEAYLQRVHPDWRAQTRQSQPGAGPSEDRAQMSRAEAYAVLGLEPGASDQDVRAAWRELMKRNHPDQGGSTYLAAKINQAKTLLTGERS